jgi:hypothetical protein
MWRGRVGTAKGRKGFELEVGMGMEMELGVDDRMGDQKGWCVVFQWEIEYIVLFGGALCLSKRAIHAMKPLMAIIRVEMPFAPIATKLPYS